MIYLKKFVKICIFYIITTVCLSVRLTTIPCFNWRGETDPDRRTIEQFRILMDRRNQAGQIVRPGRRNSQGEETDRSFGLTDGILKAKRRNAWGFLPLCLSPPSVCRLSVRQGADFEFQDLDGQTDNCLRSGNLQAPFTSVSAPSLEISATAVHCLRSVNLQAPFTSVFAPSLEISATAVSWRKMLHFSFYIIIPLSP